MATVLAIESNMLQQEGPSPSRPIYIYLHRAYSPAPGTSSSGSILKHFDDFMNVLDVLVLGGTHVALALRACVHTNMLLAAPAYLLTPGYTRFARHKRVYTKATRASMMYVLVVYCISFTLSESVNGNALILYSTHGVYA